MQKYIWIGIAASFFVLLLVILGIGLSNGEKLSYRELLFYEHSSLEQPNATCASYHKDVISTVGLYQSFVEDCAFDLDSTYNADFFSEQVIVLMFFEGSSSNKPKAFYDYLFMIDDHEVIQVRYHHSIFGVTKDSTWYVYFITMNKDQISSSKILFD